MAMIDTDGVLARWADWQAQAKQVPVAAIADGSGEPMMFVANEVLVDREDRDLVVELERMGARVLAPPPLQAAPRELAPRELTGDFPLPVRMQFDDPPPVDRPADVIDERSEEHT